MATQPIALGLPVRVLGIDQSYVSTGLAVVTETEVLYVTSEKFKKLKCKAEKRAHFKLKIDELIRIYQPDMVTIENVRHFSKGIVSMSTIVALSGLSVEASDVCWEHGIPIYSVDTRSWKARVIGSAKATKEETVDFFRAQGIDVKDHDAADALGIAKYPYSKGTPILKRQD